jgi:hypothetical protein
LTEKLNKLEKITYHKCPSHKAKISGSIRKSGSEQGQVRAAKLSIAF